MIIVSLKTYEQSSGDQVIDLCQKIKKVSQDTGVTIFPCAQAFDIRRIHQEVGIDVWAQHLDPIDPDRHSGWLAPHSAKLAGASGTVINHAEHAVPFDVIQKTVAKCQQHDLKTLVITDTIALTKKVIALKPDYLAFERPDLIGGEVSMIDAEPEQIKEVIKLAGDIPVIIGAGIRTGAQAKKTVKLGGVGVILASAVVKAADQEAALRDLASGFK